MDTGRYRRRVGGALRFLTAATVGALLSLLVLGGLRTETAGAIGTGTDTEDAYARVVARAVTDERCSYDASSGDDSAQSALIRTEAGSLRVVGFETGWQVYRGDRPGDLVAMCLGDRATTAARLRRARPAG